MKKILANFDFTLFLYSRKTLLIIFLIFLTLIGAFLRFFKIYEWFFFMIDEDLTAFLIKRMLYEKKPLLIGFSYPGDIYTGPLFYYLGALLLILSKMNPLSWAIFSSLINTLTIPLVFYVGRKIFKSCRVGLFGAIIYTFSYLINLHNRTFNPLVTGSLLTLLVYLSLYNIIVNKKLNWIYPLSLTLSFASQTEGSHLSLIALTVFIWIIYKLPLKNQKVLKAIVIFLLSHITVLIFDLRHNFVVLKALLKFFSFKESSNLNFSRVFKSFPILARAFARIFFISGPADLTKQILPCQKYLDLTLKQLPTIMVVFSSLIMGIFLVFFIFSKKPAFGLKIISIHLLIIFLGLFSYGLLLPGYAHEWFFVVFFASFCLMAAYFFDNIYRGSLFNKFFVVFFLLVFAVSNLKTTLTANSSYGFANKNEAVLYALSQVKDKDFYLESLGGCYRYGYRYLFWLHHHEPTVSYMDYLLAGWLYPKKEIKELPKSGVVIVNWKDQEIPGFKEKYLEYLKKTVEKKSFQKIEVLIIEEPAKNW